MTFQETLIDKGLTPEAARRVLSYINEARTREKTAKSKPVSNNDDPTLIALAAKWWNLGLVLDGTNVVVTGRNMAMPTFHGFRNKVLEIYPETEVDAQLVREGDTFKVGKESGHVTYSHEFGDPFSTKPIVGAYMVVKNRRGEFIETLNRDDYEKMRAQSKQPDLWNKWESEFFLKSLAKRGWKRNFNDVIQEIDEADNEDYGAVSAIGDMQAAMDARMEEAIEKIEACETLEMLREVWAGLGGLIAEPRVYEAKELKKTELTVTTEETESDADKEI